MPILWAKQTNSDAISVTLYRNCHRSPPALVFYLALAWRKKPYRAETALLFRNLERRCRCSAVQIQRMKLSEFEVVIVGAGPSGLALAIELGSRDVKCLVIERNDRVGYAPRAKTTNVRTRTHLRRWGIADKLAQASPFGVDYPSNVHFVTRLGGQSLTMIENASNCAPTRSDLYPEHGQWGPTI